jgi:hypothetical protein
MGSESADGDITQTATATFKVTMSLGEPANVPDIGTTCLTQLLRFAEKQRDISVRCLLSPGLVRN